MWDSSECILNGAIRKQWEERAFHKGKKAILSFSVSPPTFQLAQQLLVKRTQAAVSA